MQVRPRASTTLALLLGTVSLACGSDGSSDLPSRLSDVRDATAQECANGGSAVVSGVDANENGALDADEVDTTEVVCNPDGGETGETGEDGLDALVRSAVEPAGANCAEGGVRIDSGLDADRDGELDDGEIEVTTYVCNQPAGNDGVDFLVRTSSASGAQCEDGGVVLESGLDDDGSGALDDAEVEFTSVICAGADGSDRRIEIDVEPPGANCSAGGQRITEGVDLSGDGILQAPEIDEVTFLCRPVSSLVRTSTVPPGNDCPQGGLRVERGLDSNGNDQLDAAEVVDTSFYCDGGDGRATAIRTSTVPPGADCAQGGTRVQSGVDDDGDGVLDDAEVDQTSFACDADPGIDGRGNSAVRITAEPAGANCPNGGTRIETGPDTDGDGQLATGEVTNTTFACDAPNAAQNLVEITAIAPGAVCIDGGQQVDVGLDDNGDGILQAGEVDSTQVLCSAVPVVPVGITTDPNLGTVFAADDLSVISIDGVGGLGGYSWQLRNAPASVGIDPTGTPSANLTGTATTTGTLTFDVIITDAAGAVASRTFTLMVDAPPCGPGLNGAVGQSLTPLTVSSNFSSSVRGMSADADPNGWVYFTEPGIGLGRFQKNGGMIQEDLEDGITGLIGGDVGYEVEVAGNAIYVSNDNTSCTSLCVYRVSDDGGQSFVLQDIADFSGGAPNDDIRGIHVSGTTMYFITHDSVATELYSVDLSGALPAVPTLVATYADYEYCSGLEGDTRYLYTVCDDVDANSTEGVARIDLMTTTGEIVLQSPAFFAVSTTGHGAVHGQDTSGDGLFDILYVAGDSGDDYYVCDPSGPQPANPRFNREWLTGFAVDDEGMAFDRAANAIYKIQESSANVARFQ